jgi:2-polyprenyl-6-methoxyphenol hydroxylase-like FAD-dependent oxidoreductase
MAVGKVGYVGLARCEQGRLSLASAVDPKALAAAQSPHALIQQILAESGIPSPHFSTHPRWLGTRPLTQCSPRVGAERLLLLGDAAGYVEPFTGEGMAAAIDGACRVAPFVQRAAAQWRPEISADWQTEYKRYVRSRQTTIRSLAWLLRHPRLLGIGFQTISSRPQLGAVVARWVGTARPSKKKHAI